MSKINKIKTWAWWKIHEKIIMSLISQAIESLISKLEDLEYVHFKFKGKDYKFKRS